MQARSSDRSFRTLFARERRPGDLVFAIAFLLLSLFLLSQIGSQTQWANSGKLLSEPRFWPAISLGAMCLFGLGHLIGSICSPQVPGRGAEVALWLRALEYVAWFLAYVWAVPRFGYLPITLLFMLLLTLRSGYREKRILVASLVIGICIVVVFKSLLSVKIPGAELYEILPGGLRNFMLLYL